MSLPTQAHKPELLGAKRCFTLNFFMIEAVCGCWLVTRT